MPSSAYMVTECRWQLAHLYLKDKSSFWDTLTLDVLYTKAPLLLEWPHRETAGQMLLERLQHIASDVDRAYLEQVAERKNAKNRRMQAPALEETSHSSEDYVARVRRRDDTLATQVARREALKKAHTNGNIVTPVSNMLPLESQLRGGVNGLNSKPPPLSCPLSQEVSQPACNRKRQNSSIPHTQSKRSALAESDLNAGMGLTFSPTSRSGRVRSLTAGGKENYRMQT